MKIFSAIIKYSLANRFLVLALSVIVACYGLYTASKLPIDILPDLDKTMATIVTEVPGMVPEEIESLVNIPLETALGGMGGVKKIRASCVPSLSLVNIEFEWDADPFKVRQLIQERLQVASEALPENVNPIIAPISSVMGEIMLVGLFSKDASTSPQDLRTIADYTIARRLSNIPGVSQVLSTGGELKQYRIVPDPHKMLAYGVSLGEIEEAARNAQSNTGGGLVDVRGVEISIRNVGRTSDISEIAESLVKLSNGTHILLKDVADVRIDKAQLRGDAAVNGNSGIVMTVQKQPNVDTIKITREIEKALNEISKGLPENAEIKIIYRQDGFIDAAIKNVGDAIVDGSVMVVVILFLFLFNIRTTLITITAIPISFAMALIYFSLSGSSINTMTLGGLAVAVGMLVDDAIVDVENVYRRLKENAALNYPKTSAAVILDACVEIRASIFYATAIIVIVFIPTFALQGIEGKMFRPLSEAVIVSMSASFLVALTLIPVLCSLFLKKTFSEKARKEPIGSRIVKFIAALFLIRPAVRYPRLALFLSSCLCAAAFALFPLMGRDFIPPLNEGSVLVMLQLSPESSLERSNKVARLAENILMTIPEVESIGRKIGRAEKDDHAEPVNIIKFYVNFSESEKSNAILSAEMREKLEALPGVGVSVGQPMAHRLDYMLSGVQSQIAVKIFGEDLNILHSKAQELAEKIRNTKGSTDVNVESQVMTPQIKISVDREKAKLYGVQVGKINDMLGALLAGKIAGEVNDAGKLFDIFIRSDGMDSAQKIGDLLIENSEGKKYPLSNFAKVEISKGPNSISRENLERRIVISLNVGSGDSVSLAERVKEIINETEFPAGYYATVEGQFQSRVDAGRRMGYVSVLAMLAIFAMLFTHFKSFNLVMQILLCVPLAFSGGLALTWFFIGTMSVASLIGMIALAGIAARNTIMLVSHYLHLMKYEGENFSHSMIIRGTLERLNPILMTALTAAFALLPLMLDSDSPGKELLYPVSVMIVGGLVSSTFLSLVVSPALFAILGSKEMAVKE